MCVCEDILFLRFYVYIFVDLVKRSVLWTVLSVMQMTDNKRFSLCH